MPKAHHMNYAHITVLWFVACALCIGLGLIVPVVGWLFVIMGVLCLPFTPFVKWMILVVTCPYCQKEDWQLSWKGSYKCQRCKQVVLIARGDRTGEYETLEIKH